MISRPNEKPEELISMIAHIASCKYCEGPIKMLRDRSTGKLRPDDCMCFGCGQRYFMLIDNIDKWELDQWQQKNEKI